MPVPVPVYLDVGASGKSLVKKTGACREISRVGKMATAKVVALRAAYSVETDRLNRESANGCELNIALNLLPSSN